MTVRKKDDLWKYTTRDPKRRKERFKCKFCGKDFAPTTHIGRIRFHLAGVLQNGVHGCAKVKEDVKRQALDGIPKPNKYSTSNVHFGEKAINGHSTKRKKRSCSPNSDTSLSETSDANCSNEVDNLFAKFFVMIKLHCSDAASPSFLNLVHGLRTKCPGRYVPPSPDKLRRLIPSVQQEFEQKVASARQSLERSSFTVVPHVWRIEKEDKSFLSIIACSRESALLLDTYELPKETPRLEEVFRMVVSVAGAEKIVHCIMVDDAPWARPFVDFLNREYAHIRVTNCAALCIQSLLEAICTKVECVRHVLDESEIIFHHACMNNVILAPITREYNNGSKELKQQYRRCYMLGAIFETKQELVKLVQSPERLSSGYVNGRIGNKAIQTIKNEEFWDQVEKLHMALKPFLKALQLDDIGQLGVDDLYWLMGMAEEAIGTLCKDYPDKCHRMGDIFKSRRRQIIDGIHKAATFLNPQIMLAETVRQRREVKEDIDYMLQKLVFSDDKIAFENETGLYYDMLSNHPECLPTVAAEDLTPRKWWNEFGERFPVLAKYAVKISSQPCSSASLTSSLRAFLANQIEERNGVVPQLDYLRSRMNEVFMEKFNTHETSEREKVDLEEFRKRSLTSESSELSGGYIVTEKGSTSRHLTRSGSELSAPQHVSSLSSAETGHIVNGESNDCLLTRSTVLSGPQYLKLRFRTTISRTICVGQKVEGEQVSQIHVFIEDPSTGAVLQVGLGLTVSVLDGDCINEEASGDVHWTREQYSSNELRLTRDEPLVTGDLELMLVQGVGTLGEFSFNYSSKITSSGKFRLGVKTDTGYCGEFRILEGISSAFVVMDDEDLLRLYASPSEVPLRDDFDSLSNEGFNQGIPHGQHELANNNGSVNYTIRINRCLTGPSSFPNYGLQSCSKRKHVAAIRIKRKAVLHLYQRYWRKRFLEQSNKAVPSAKEEVQCLEAEKFEKVSLYLSGPESQSSSSVVEDPRLEAVKLERVSLYLIEAASQSSSAVEEDQYLFPDLDDKEDNYDGVILDLSEPMSAEVYRVRLQDSMSKWRHAKKRAVWIKLPIALANLVAPTVQEGFKYHHAEEGYIMLTTWLSDTPSTIPANASHRIGIGAFVMNDKNEVLVVQEISGKFKGKGVWKLPTGVVNEGEDICTGAIREVKEETGIDCEFLEILAFRQSHQSYFNKSDIFFVCMMQPLSYEIEKQTQEILEAQWMPIEEYAAQDFVQKNEQFKFIAEVCIARSKENYNGFVAKPYKKRDGSISYMYCHNHIWQA